MTAEFYRGRLLAAADMDLENALEMVVMVMRAIGEDPELTDREFSQVLSESRLLQRSILEEGCRK